MSVNKVILLGRLGQDPEIKYIPSGSSVCHLSVATSDVWVDKNGQKQERTEWHRIVVWDKLADLCGQYLKKGRQVFVEGKLQTRSWDDKNGNKRYTTEILAKTIQFIGSNSTSDQANVNSNGHSTTETPPFDNNENLKSDQISGDIHFTSEDIPF